MSNHFNKPSVRKQAKDALARISDAEMSITQLAAGVNQAINRINNQLSHAVEQIDALVSILGEEAVITAVQQNRISRARAQAEHQKAQVQEAVVNKKLLVADVIRGATRDENGQVRDPGCFVEGVEYDADGTAIPPEYLFMRMSEFKPEFHDKLVGQTAGSEIVTDYKDAEGKPMVDAEGNERHGRFVITRVLELAPPEAAAPAPAETKPALAVVPPPATEQEAKEDAQVQEALATIPDTQQG